MKDYTLEVCVDSVESAVAAQRGGATRLELCSSLVIGGVTPSLGLFCEVRKAVDIKIHVLIRPRFGDFCYTEAEKAVMDEDIRRFTELGADGVVIGSLNADGTLNLEQMERMIFQAGGRHITMHRAFDLCRESLHALEECAALGVQTILTSGQEENCLKGAVLLSQLQKASKGRIHILAGAGVNADNLEELHKLVGLDCYHMSGKKVLDSRMEYRKEGVPMGIPGISEFSVWQTDEMEIRRAAEILERSSYVFR